MKLAYFPELLPDELLFSGIAALRRFHEEASSDFLKTCIGLRGSTRAYLGLPTRLNEFVNTLPICSALTVDRIVRDHTLTPLIHSFLKSRPRGFLAGAIRGEVESARIDGLHELLVHSDKRLRYCPDCWPSDRKKNGRAYWHRCHQVKHVTACHLHGCQLVISDVSWLTPSNRSSFLTPDDLVPVERTPANDEEITLAKDVFDVVHGGFELNHDAVLEAAHELLRRAGMLHVDRGINWQELRKVIGLKFNTAQLSAFGTDLDKLSQLWSPGLSRSASSNAWLNPFDYYVIVSAIDQSLSSLLQLAATQPWEAGPWICMNELAPCHNEPSIRNYDIHEGKARLTCPTCCGSYFRPLPLRTNPDGTTTIEPDPESKGWRAALPALWRNLELPRADIAQRLGKSETQILANAAALRIKRRTLGGINLAGIKPPATEDLIARRKEWRALVANNPGVMKSTLTAENPGLSEWMYRNDREWLAQNSPIIPRKKRQSTIDYAKRDADLAASIPHVAQEYLNQVPPIQLSVCLLLRHLKLPISKEHASKTYPRTFEAASAAVSNQPDYISRVLEAVEAVWRERETVPTWYEFVATRPMLAKRCTRDGAFKNVVLERYRQLWPENPFYAPGTLRLTQRKHKVTQKLSPAERLANCIYPFGELKESQSFFVPSGEKTRNQIRQTVVRSMHYFKQDGILPSDFLLEATDDTDDGDDGVRFVRKKVRSTFVVNTVIDTPIPPTSPPTRINLPLAHMNVGDSFFLPNNGGTALSTERLVHERIVEMKHQGTLPDSYPILTKPEIKNGIEGVRIWRAHPPEPVPELVIEELIPMPDANPAPSAANLGYSKAS